MFTIRSKYSNPAFFVTLTGIIYLTALYIQFILPSVLEKDLIARALTIDLMILVPFLYWLFMVRRQGLSWITVIPVVFLSFYGASLILPMENRQLLDLFPYLLIPLEFFIVGYIGTKTFRAVRLFRKSRVHEADIMQKIGEVSRSVIDVPIAADIFAYEICLFYYALFSWGRKPGSLEMGAYSYHKKPGYTAILFAILMILFVELFAVHLLIIHFWGLTPAWILTALSIYGIIWLMGDYRAIVLRHVIIKDHILSLRLGLRWSLDIPFANVASFSLYDKHYPIGKKDHLNAVLLGDPRYLVVLKEPLKAQGIYGINKRVKTIGFSIDADHFADELFKRVGKDENERF